MPSAERPPGTDTVFIPMHYIYKYITKYTNFVLKIRHPLSLTQAMTVNCPKSISSPVFA